jgi:hypothetical protein
MSAAPDSFAKTKRSVAQDDPLLEELAAANEYVGRPGMCKLCFHLASMTDQRREGVETYVAGTMGAQRLAEILTKGGYPIGKSTIIDHRKGHKS